MLRKIYKNLAFLIAATGNSLILLPLFRRFKNRYQCYAVPDAAICIEGFPRSGNSFFVAVFQQWNPGVVVAHHTHLASNAKYTARQNKPTVVLIREPAEAIASTIAWDGHKARIAPGVGLLSYLSFYSSLRRYDEKILYLDFNEVVNQPVESIEKINKRFGVNFVTQEFTEKENHRIRDVLLLQDRQENRTEINSTLPNEKKNSLKKVIIPSIKSHSLFTQAQKLYDEFK